ncbi:MAG: hypothetical protein JWO67_642 [Streptosporangiaceae bacterium]|nr:hypothetical protein [Streptosporangiaceae bacterium]
MASLLKRRTLLLNGTLAVLLAAGVGFAYISLAGDGGGAGAATRTSQVLRGTVEQSVSASGSVQSAKTQSLDFAASGTVTHIYVKAGDKVTKGKVLARLDRTGAQENVTAALASLDAADDDTSTAKSYAGYITARNAYRNAVRTLNGTVITAPFSGTVTAVNGTVGGSSSGSGGASSGASSGTGSSAGGGSTSSGSSATSSSGTSSTSPGSGGFIELADLSKLQIQGNFTESDTTKLKVGQAATASFDALTGVTAPGKVTAIGVSPTTSNNVVQYSVTVTLGTKPPGVRLGQTATVEVTVARASDVLYVPTAAVHTAGGLSTVTVQPNGSQVAKTVETGVRGAQGTEITSGLNEGDRVVITVAGSGSNGLPGAGIGGGAGRVGRGGAGLPGGGRP